MFNCERCGAGYSPIRAAILEFCPRCWGRDQVHVPLVVKVFRDLPRRRVGGGERALGEPRDP
jgi:predicted  nucleic acid-binding Zn-ribbon protein